MKFLLAMTLMMAACGSEGDESSTDGTPNNLWTAEQVSHVKNNCSEGGSDGMRAFCSCMVEEFSKKYTYDDFIANELGYTRQSVEDGQADRCRDIAKEFSS